MRQNQPLWTIHICLVVFKMQFKVFFIYNTELKQYVCRGSTKSPRVYFDINQAKSQIREELKYCWWSRSRADQTVRPEVSENKVFEIHEFDLDYKGKVKWA